MFEYNNTIRDLLGPTTAPPISAGAVAVDLPTDVMFVNGAPITSAVDARAFMEISDKIAGGAGLANIVPQGCAAPAAAAEQGCATNFIKQFGLRAFRRPLTSDEEADLAAVYTKVRSADVGGNYTDGIKALVSAMVQSPYFLYRWELGGAPTKEGTLVRLNSYEIASRVSYFITASMPDDALFTAAGKNELVNVDRVAEHTRRLLASPKAKDGMRDFVLQLLKTAALPSMAKDETYTDYNPTVAKAMLDETAEFFSGILQGSSPKLESVFTEKSTFSNAGLTKVYGPNRATERAGILTLGAFTASHAEGDVQHPIKRGAHILNHLLCVHIEPPDFVIPPVPDRLPTQTTRQRFEMATQNAAAGAVCTGCHRQLNPVGFAFENYGAIGQWQATEGGQPIDASGTATALTNPITFKNAIELSKGLGTSVEARECMSKQFLYYVLRREETPEEKASMAQLLDAFKNSGYDLRELVVATTRTRAFTHRMPLAGEGQP